MRQIDKDEEQLRNPAFDILGHRVGPDPKTKKKLREDFKEDLLLGNAINEELSGTVVAYNASNNSYSVEFEFANERRRKVDLNPEQLRLFPPIAE